VEELELSPAPGISDAVERVQVPTSATRHTADMVRRRPLLRKLTLTGPASG
jgi:hypothetical protein